VHPDAAARRAWNRARELEAAEPGGPCAVEADRVRRPTAGDENVAPNLRRRELAVEPEHNGVDALVGDKQVRAESDRRDRKPALARPGKRLRDLGHARPPRERPPGPASAARRIATDRTAGAARPPSAPR